VLKPSSDSGEPSTGTRISFTRSMCGSPRTSTTGTLEYPDLDDLGSKRRGKRPGRWQGGLGLGGAIQRDQKARVHRSIPVAAWPQGSGKQRI
jgi:hypothetical protein